MTPQQSIESIEIQQHYHLFTPAAEQPGLHRRPTGEYNPISAEAGDSRRRAGTSFPLATAAVFLTVQSAMNAVIRRLKTG